ncbi:MAG: cytochrome ubiquinol oxidase subunit I, partial [Actinobacteria bacterium]|nr:cytochrome ubiquinol oxidase subunit I [Actinomycetota bacterium]
WYVWISRNAPLVNTNDPWGWGRSLEGATSSPPPRFNFDKMPSIRSFSPALDASRPELRQPVNPAQDTIDELTSGDAK